MTASYSRIPTGKKTYVQADKPSDPSEGDVWIVVDDGDLDQTRIYTGEVFTREL